MPSQKVNERMVKECSPPLDRPLLKNANTYLGPTPGLFEMSANRIELRVTATPWFPMECDNVFTDA